MNIPVIDSHLNNSFDLIHKLKDLQVDDKYILISLDVVSLFTKIPIDLAIVSVSNRWKFVDDHCSILMKEFVSGLY